MQYRKRLRGANMGNYFLKEVMRLFFYAMTVIVYIEAYAMDLQDSQRYAVMPTTMYLVGSFLLTHKMNLFDQDMICSLGVINKEWHNIAKNAAVKLRECFESKIQKDCCNCSGYKENTIIWHQYGTALGKKCIYTCDDDNNTLLDNQKKRHFHLDSIYWSFGDIEIYTSNIIYGIEKTVKNIIRPRFDERSSFCAYSIAIDRMLWSKSEQVIEYCLAKDRDLYSLDSPMRSSLCILRLKKNKNSSLYCVLSHFLPFPFLLECLLHSKVIEDCLESRKVYNLKDAIIPDNYQECIPIDNDGYQSFDKLPKEIREEITKHYKQQQAQRKRLASKKRKTLNKIVFWK